MTLHIAVLACAFAFADGTTTPRGVTGSVTITHSGDAIVAQPDQELTAPLIVRVTDLTPSAADGFPHKYRIDFIGAIEGEHDLRKHLRHRDGSQVDELAPVIVTIVSELPEHYGTDLFGTPTRPFFTRNHYRFIAWILGTAWICVPIVFVWKRWLRNRPGPPPTPPPPKPTLADQLRPLAESAMRGELSLDGQARLELLLIAFWSERLNLAALSPAQALAQLRIDPEASPLLLAVERWLHSREGSSDSITALLEPYRAHAPVELAEEVR